MNQRVDYLIFQLPEPDEVVGAYSVFVGHDENQNVYYILDDESHAGKVFDVLEKRPIRVNQKWLDYWAYKSKVKLDG